MFLNMFLKHPEVVKSKHIPVYFNSVAIEKSDKQAIEDLVLHLSGKPPKKQMTMTVAPQPVTVT